MSVSIRDIAKVLGINPATVSCCLSGSYRERRISEKLAERVRIKAEEMGYIPNRLASRIFRRNNRKNIALIFKNDTARLRTLPVLDAAIRFLGERNDCDFSVLYSKDENLHESLKNGIGLGIRDFIVIGYISGSDLIKSQLEKLPPLKIYACDYYFDDTDRDFPSVVCKIGFNRNTFYSQLKSAYEKAGLGPVKQVYALVPGKKGPDESDPITYNAGELEDPFLFGQEVLAPIVEKYVRKRKCRTLLFRNDAMAIGTVNALLSRGIRIPEDLAVVGFNNSPFSAYTAIPLTTISLPVREKLEKLLLDILEDRPIPPVIHTSPQLISRKSAPAVLLS